MPDTVRRRVKRACEYRRDTPQCAACRHSVEHGDGIGCHDAICDLAQDECRCKGHHHYPEYAEYPIGFDEGEKNA